MFTFFMTMKQQRSTCLSLSLLMQSLAVPSCISSLLSPIFCLPLSCPLWLSSYLSFPSLSFCLPLSLHLRLSVWYRPTLTFSLSVSLSVCLSHCIPCMPLSIFSLGSSILSCVPISHWLFSSIFLCPPVFLFVSLSISKKWYNAEFLLNVNLIWSAIFYGSVLCSATVYKSLKQLLQLMAMMMEQQLPRSVTATTTCFSVLTTLLCSLIITIINSSESVASSSSLCSASLSACLSGSLSLSLIGHQWTTLSLFLE